MKIRFISPFSFDRNRHGFPNIGGAYNEAISELPNDCWVVLTDQDVLFLTADTANHIKEIIEANPEYDLITCITNRLGVKDHFVPIMFDNPDISDHIKYAQNIRCVCGNEVTPAKLSAGLCMIFRKELWVKVGGFPEFDITFDRVFSHKVLKSGGKIGIAKGLYIFHLYRWNEKNPKNSIKHLTK